MGSDLHDLSIGELGSLIGARKLSPVELVEALIQRVEQYDGQTRAFITRTFDLARRQAKQASRARRGRASGPVARSPFALKDIYDTQGNPPPLTSAHSRVFIDRIPAEDATATTRLYDAGAVLLGKLATHEMAHAGRRSIYRGLRAQSLEPCALHWRLLVGFGGGGRRRHGPGCPGLDTGGSIRGPASCAVSSA